MDEAITFEPAKRFKESFVDLGKHFPEEVARFYDIISKEIKSLEHFMSLRLGTRIRIKKDVTIGNPMFYEDGALDVSHGKRGIRIKGCIATFFEWSDYELI